MLTSADWILCPVECNFCIDYMLKLVPLPNMMTRTIKLPISALSTPPQLGQAGQISQPAKNDWFYDHLEGTIVSKMDGWLKVENK